MSELRKTHLANSVEVAEAKSQHSECVIPNEGRAAFDIRFHVLTI